LFTESHKQRIYITEHTAIQEEIFILVILKVKRANYHQVILLNLLWWNINFITDGDTFVFMTQESTVMIINSIIICVPK